VSGPNVKHDVFSLYNMDVGEDECWVWNGGWGGRDRTRRPYFQFGGHRMIAYRAIYELVHGVKLHSDQLIRHTCDNGGAPTGCGNPAHLKLGTNVENMDDMKERNRHGLTRNAVKGIRRLLDKGRTQQEIADLYGVSQTSISAIAQRRTYAHIEDDPPEELEPIEEVKA
jgi:DNA-binding XRE family transcriptional regulator